MIYSHSRQPIAPKIPKWILSDLNRYLHKEEFAVCVFNGAIYEIRTHDSALAKRRVNLYTNTAYVSDYPLPTDSNARSTFPVGVSLLMAEGAGFEPAGLAPQ